MKRTIAAAVVFLALVGSKAFAGPFGFDRGMTKEQVIRLVGQSAVAENKDNKLVLTTAPKPHSEFEQYVLAFSPKDGLLKVVAVGKDIPTDRNGDELRQEFDRLHSALVTIYGQADKDYDFLVSGSIWTEPQDFTMGLIKLDRNLDSYWNFTGRGDKITAMELNAKALRPEVGYIKVGYEFEGWNAYIDSRTAKQDSVL